MVFDLSNATCVWLLCETRWVSSGICTVYALWCLCFFNLLNSPCNQCNFHGFNFSTAVTLNYLFRLPSWRSYQALERRLGLSYDQMRVSVTFETKDKIILCSNHFTMSRNYGNSNFIWICICTLFCSHIHFNSISIQTIFLRLDFSSRWNTHVTYVRVCASSSKRDGVQNQIHVQYIFCALEHLSRCKILIHFRSVKL